MHPLPKTRYRVNNCTLFWLVAFSIHQDHLSDPGSRGTERGTGTTQRAEHTQHRREDGRERDWDSMLTAVHIGPTERRCKGAEVHLLTKFNSILFGILKDGPNIPASELLSWVTHIQWNWTSVSGYGLIEQ